MIQNRARRQQKIFRSALGVRQRRTSGEACDAHSVGSLPRWRRSWLPCVPMGRDDGEQGRSNAIRGLDRRISAGSFANRGVSGHRMPRQWTHYIRFIFAMSSKKIRLIIRLTCPLVDLSEASSKAWRGARRTLGAILESRLGRVDKVGILVIDDDAAGQAALRQMLESEDWELHAEPVASRRFRSLATGDWTLVIASIGMTGLAGPLYTTLRELALAPLSEAGKARLRVLFVIPENAEQQTRSTLESEHLPYVQKPFNLHELLERVSDLLMETEAIAAPIRRVREQGLLGSRSARGGAFGCRPAAIPACSQAATNTR